MTTGTNPNQHKDETQHNTSIGFEASIRTIAMATAMAFGLGSNAVNIAVGRLTAEGMRQQEIVCKLN